MDDTLWLKIRPGERASDVSEQMGDPALLVHDGIPDWVRLPPELGGQRVRVKGMETRTCPCGRHVGRTFILDEPSGIQVAECPSRGYLWFREKRHG